MSVLEDILTWSTNRPMWKCALRRLLMNGETLQSSMEDLVENRARWLNPESETEAKLRKKTLTNLYNQRPTWLDLAHQRLDDAVLDAYGWPHDITDDQILERLLALNLERPGKDGAT